MIDYSHTVMRQQNSQSLLLGLLITISHPILIQYPKNYTLKGKGKRKENSKRNRSMGTKYTDHTTNMLIIFKIKVMLGGDGARL